MTPSATPDESAAALCGLAPTRPARAAWVQALLRFVLLGTLLQLPTALASIVQEDFSTDPVGNGWHIHGDGSLFDWDASNEVLRVTWDSSKTNSYFYFPLKNLLTRSESFEASFDLRVDEIAVGTTIGKPYTFQIAVCLFDIEAAKRTNFFMGSGSSASSGPRSTMEFDYFPAYEDPIYGQIDETFAVIAVPTNTNPYLVHHDYPLPLDTGVWHRVTLRYDASSQTVILTKTRAGMPYGTVQAIPLTDGFDDVRINAFSISSYSDRVGLGSVRAHGVIDNISIALPDPPISNITLTLVDRLQAEVHFLSHTGWSYALERSQMDGTWIAVAPAVPGTGGPTTLTDTNTSPNHAFYRIRAQQP